MIVMVSRKLYFIEMQNRVSSLIKAYEKHVISRQHVCFSKEGTLQPVYYEFLRNFPFEKWHKNFRRLSKKTSQHLKMLKGQFKKEKRTVMKLQPSVLKEKAPTILNFS